MFAGNNQPGPLSLINSFLCLRTYMSGGDDCDCRKNHLPASTACSIQTRWARL